MGDSEKPAVILPRKDDRRMRLEFRGATITSDPPQADWRPANWTKPSG